MKLGCLNIRSIRNKTVAVNDVFSDHKLDALALTEAGHEASFDTCLAAIIQNDGSIVEQARPVSRKATTSDSFVNHAGIVCLACDDIKMAKINLPHKPVPFEGHEFVAVNISIYQRIWRMAIDTRKIPTIF